MVSKGSRYLGRGGYGEVRMFYYPKSLSGFIPTCSHPSRGKKENEFDEKNCIRSRRTFFLIFDVCNMFFFLSLQLERELFRRGIWFSSQS